MPEKETEGTHLGRFLNERTSTPEMRQNARHLFRERGTPKKAPSETPTKRGYDYAQTLADLLPSLNSRKEVLFGQRLDAPVLLQELLEHPPERRRVFIHNSQRYGNLPLADLLIKESRKLVFRQAGTAIHFAELALEISDSLEGGSLSAALVSDLQGRCRACLANALRVNGELRAAEEIFRKAEEFYNRGTGDLLQRAEIISLKAALRSEQGLFNECFSLLDRAASIYRRCGEQHLLGRTLIKKGTHYFKAGEPDSAIPLLHGGIGMVDLSKEPRLAVAATHNLILSLLELERHEESDQLLKQWRPQYEQLGNPLDMLRLRWLEGRVAQSKQDFDEAEAAFIQTQSGFIAEGITVDAAVISLDLAAIYVQQGRTSEIKRIAEEILPIFRASDLHREVFASLILFQRAAQMEKVTLNLIRDTMAQLNRLARERQPAT